MIQGLTCARCTHVHKTTTPLVPSLHGVPGAKVCKARGPCDRRIKGLIHNKGAAAFLSGRVIVGVAVDLTHGGVMQVRLQHDLAVHAGVKKGKFSWWVEV